MRKKKLDKNKIKIEIDDNDMKVNEIDEKELDEYY